MACLFDDRIFRHFSSASRWFRVGFRPDGHLEGVVAGDTVKRRHFNMIDQNSEPYQSQLDSSR